VSEILGYLNDPRNVLVSALEKALFWKYPWRKDVSGSEALVRAATVKDLQAIRDAWYVPNNAALFIGGDVDPRAVRAAVEKSFGDWPKAADPWASPPPPQEAPPRDVLLAFPDEQVSPGVVAVTLRYRGPDVTRDPTATWAADVWGSLLSDPNGRFVTEMARRVPGLYRKDYMSASYRTQRDGGYISFSTLLLLQKGRDTFGRAVLLKKAFANLCANMAADRSYFTKHDFEVLVRQLSDQRIWERETVDGFLDQLSFWWATAGIDYYNGYDEALAKVGSPEIATFLQGWVLGKTSVLAVRMNPDDFAKEKRSAERQGWTVVSADNAYWWKSTKTGGAR
ncbi:MAG TPA: insulinase family protein, partial [Spirochaetia bacterium]